MSEDSVIAEFQNITGCDVERAKFYLESANNQLDLAISNFYESDGMDVEPVPEEPPQAGVAAVGAAEPAAAAGGQAAAGAGVNSRINFPPEDSDSDDDDEGGQEKYAGGSTSSGNVVIGPGRNKKDIVGKLFRKAKESGAEEVQPGEFGARGGSSSQAFQGGGFKLGGENTPSVAVGGPSVPVDKPRTFVLKMWQNGFSIDDGELREYTNPQNREFLASIMKGTIPTELVKEAKGGEVHVDMEDHRQEEYVKPKVTVKPFQGQGNTLGSIAPQVTASAGPASADPAQDEDKAKTQAKVDDSQPTANIQVRLADGSRLVVRLNHTHTVADLRSYICTARSQYTSAVFSLLTTFPNKELTDESQSIKEAGLVGAAVLQRLK